MKIKTVRTTPLFCRFKQPYHWSRGAHFGAPIILVEIETSDGTVGIGETVAGPNFAFVQSIIDYVVPFLVGQSLYDGLRIVTRCYETGFASQGNGPKPRSFAQGATGIEMAIWDAIGKAADKPLHQILGGKINDRINYFAFPQGDTADEVVTHAKSLDAQGFAVFYVKVGRGHELDIEIVRSVRNVIGEKRLRLDANEAWDMLTARRMIKELSPYKIEFLEQPIPAQGGAAALAELRRTTDMAIAADQAVYTPNDVYEIARNSAADVVVLGIHETGGIANYRKAAVVAEVAGISICMHGVFESGITTCASNQLASTIPNIDDGNQIMQQLLEEDLVTAPNLNPVNGALEVSDLPGLGFELNREAVKRAALAFNNLPSPAGRVSPSVASC